MASIRKRGNAWQARVIRKGFPDETATFKTKAEALEWSRDVETSMDAGRYRHSKEAEETLLCDLLQRYRETVTPLKRGATDEAIRLKALERRRLAKLALVNVSPQAIAAFRDERLAECSPATVIRDWPCFPPSLIMLGRSGASISSTLCRWCANRNRLRDATAFFLRTKNAG